MHYGVVDADGKLAHYVDVPLPGPRLPHDMAFTERYAILNDCPMFWAPEPLAAGHHVPTFYSELPTRFGILPRRGQPEDVRWFEADPTFVLHWINAYEDGDEVVLDGFFQGNPSPRRDRDLSAEQNLFRYLDSVRARDDRSPLALQLEDGRHARRDTLRPHPGVRHDQRAVRRSSLSLLVQRVAL